MGSSSVLQRSVVLPAAALLLCAGLAGCSSSTPAASGPATASTSAAAAPSSAAGSATAPAGSDGGSGTITFKGTVSGKMTIDACPDGKIAQLTVDVDGQPTTYAGVIDASDFAFTGPSSTAYSLAKGEPKPKVAGQTYTVENVKLVSIVNDKDVVTASGSVTCP